MAINEWSTTASNNASGVTNVNWAEGQAPSTVNDSARNLMADIATWLGQASGAIPEYLTSVAGTNTITATGPKQMAGYVAGQRFTFIPANTNTGATTINITPSGASALGAKNVFCNGVACGGGELTISVPALVVYDGTQFNIMAPASARGGASRVLLDTQTASNSASLNFTTGITSTYDVYEFEFVTILPATDGANFNMRVSTDAGANYKQAGTDYVSCGTGHSTATTDLAYTSATAAQMTINSTAVGLDNAAGSGLSGFLKMYAPSSSSTRKRFLWDVEYEGNEAGTNPQSRVQGGGGYIAATTAINAVQFLMGTGNITSGFINMYGIRKA